MTSLLTRLVTRLRPTLATLLRRAAAVFADAFASLAARPGRSTAMVAGIVLGVASATAAVLLADTQQAQIDKRFDLQRSNQAVVQAQAPPATGFDAAALRDIAALPVVDAVGEVSIWQSSTPVAQTPAATPIGLPVVVLDPGGAAAITAHTQTGLPLRALADPQPHPWAWLGARAAARLGINPTHGPTTVTLDGQNLPLCRRHHLRHRRLRVRRLRRHHQPPPGHRQVRRRAEHPPRRPRAPRLSPRRRHLHAGARRPHPHPPAHRRHTPRRSDPAQGVATDLRTAGLAVGAFVGLVGMITVANTLTMSVTQRTRELGLRSAMGWSRRRIASLIIIESTLAGTVASLIGCGTGIAASITWSLHNHWQLIVDPHLPPTVILGGILACILGGLLPARRAASIAPITAMRD